MENIKLHYSKRLAYCPAFTAIMVAYVDLLKLGQTNPKLEFSNNAQVVYVTANDQRIIGASLFQIGTESDGFVLFSFVAPDCRNQGIYKMMYTEVEKHLINQGALCINSGTWHDNDRMREIFKNTDREETSIRTAKCFTKQLPF